MTVAYKSPATSSNLNNSFISRTDNQNASGEINFVNGIEINGTPISNADGNIKIESVKSLILPSGTSSDRGASATWVDGMVRYNEETNLFEGREAGAWVNFSTGSSDGGRLIGSPQVFTASGTYDKTVNNPSYVIVWVQGGGGGSGGNAATGSGQYAGSGGGGGGEFGWKRINFADLSSTETVTVGAGGAGGSAGNNNGSTGGTSSFGAHITAIGGGGGGGSASGTNLYNSGGVGGTGGTGGTWYISGDDGGFGRAVASTTWPFSHGGGSHLAGAKMVEQSGGVGAGVNGKIYGGGAAGALSGQSQSARAGGDGGAGVVIVFEYA